MAKRKIKSKDIFLPVTTTAHYAITRPRILQCTHKNQSIGKRSYDLCDRKGLVYLVLEGLKHQTHMEGAQCTTRHWESTQSMPCVENDVPMMVRIYRLSGQQRIIRLSRSRSESQPMPAAVGRARRTVALHRQVITLPNCHNTAQFINFAPFCSSSLMSVVRIGSVTWVLHSAPTSPKFSLLLNAFS